MPKAKIAHIVSKAPHAEHLGFVAYAGCETFKVHSLIYSVSVWLLITGLLAIVVEAWFKA